MKLIHLSALALLTSCTFSVNLVHTEGSASDVVDENQRADPDVNTSLEIPAHI
jgi:hypothetical protein